MKRRMRSLVWATECCCASFTTSLAVTRLSVAKSSNQTSAMPSTTVSGPVSTSETRYFRTSGNFFTKASEMLQPDASLVGEGKEVAPAGQQHFVPIELRQNILYTVSNAPRHSQGSKPLGQAAAVNQPIVGPDDGGPRNPLEGTDKL